MNSKLFFFTCVFICCLLFGCGTTNDIITSKTSFRTLYVDGEPSSSLIVASLKNIITNNGIASLSAITLKGEIATNWLDVLRYTLPLAEFISDKQNIGSSGGTVTFTSVSTGVITNYVWDFGDGTMIGTNAGVIAHEYAANTDTNPVTYTVALTAAGTYRTDTNIKSNYVTVAGELPEVALGSLVFNGTDSYITSSSSYFTGTVWTIDFWVKSGNASQNAQIGGNYNYSVGWLYIGTECAYQYGIGSDCPGFVFDFTPLSTNSWEHIAYTVDVGNNSVILWRNGVGVATNSLFELNFQSGQSTFIFGRAPYDAGGWFNGKLSQVRLSKSLRWTGNFTPPIGVAVDADTVFLLRCNEGTGMTAYDATGQYNFTLSTDDTNYPTWDIDKPESP